ncbi:MAG: glutamate--cysteine ligase, partial [Gammaproteobacteria bacterium]|nr:glutamate--cysteine ligase [Gammaproteobacteria bacterium]
MGDEISTHLFDETAYQQFQKCLESETSLLNEWLHTNKLNDDKPVGGFEQEAWLIDKHFNPAPLNEKFMGIANQDYICAELAQFNIELNVTPLTLTGSCLSELQNELDTNWQYCQQVADKLDCKLVMIGILPTVRDQDLTLKNLSPLNRYKALNEQVMQARKGMPMHLEITGTEHLESVHYDVMLESAATSFQIHRQIPANLAPAYINYSMILSAITVAVGANSPYLFGKQLWEETRIPLFEQAVEVGGMGSAVHGPIRRVSFGNGYIRNDIFECFLENLEHYPVLLPVELDDSNSDLPYLRLHNGTIWRWNRP